MSVGLVCKFTEPLCKLIGKPCYRKGLVRWRLRSKSLWIWDGLVDFVEMQCLRSCLMSVNWGEVHNAKCSVIHCKNMIPVTYPTCIHSTSWQSNQKLKLHRVYWKGLMHFLLCQVPANTFALKWESPWPIHFMVGEFVLLTGSIVFQNF